MIHDGALQRFDGGRKLPRREAVCPARPAIAARVIVGEQDARAAMRRRIRHDRTKRNVRAARVAVVAGQMEAVRLAIDVRHPQTLSSGIGLGKAAGEEGAGRIESVQLERLLGTLIAHST